MRDGFMGGRSRSSGQPGVPFLDLHPSRRQLLLRGALLAGIAVLSERPEAVAPGFHTAYIDPGSGALALQLLASVVVGLLFYVKRVREYLGRTWEWLLRRKRN